MYILSSEFHIVAAVTTEWSQTLHQTGHLPIKAQSYSNPITSLNRPWGFQKVEAPRFQDNRHMKVLRLSALRTGSLYPAGNIPGTHFCYRMSRPQGRCAAGRIMSVGNSNDIGNRTRDLPACNAVPQPTVPPRGPQLGHSQRFINCLTL